MSDLKKLIEKNTSRNSRLPEDQLFIFGKDLDLLNKLIDELINKGDKQQ